MAERICAHSSKMNPTHRKCSMCGMNLLAASVQFWAKPEIIDYISKKDFNPVPEVDSAIIKLTTNNQQPITKEAGKYYKLIKILFKQPRKTIFNNLRLMTNDQQLIKVRLESLKINVIDRPQNLSLEQVIQLSKIFSDIL